MFKLNLLSLLDKENEMELYTPNEVDMVADVLIKEEVSPGDIQNTCYDDFEDNMADNFKNSVNVDESLTSLEWLQNLNIMSKLGSPTPPTPPASPLMNSEKQSTCSNDLLSKVPSNKKDPIIEYKNNPKIKPPYSYATLICMAMKENNNKMTLAAIYKWIKENFIFYRNADQSWQVRIILIIIYSNFNVI